MATRSGGVHYSRPSKMVAERLRSTEDASMKIEEIFENSDAGTKFVTGKLGEVFDQREERMANEIDAVMEEVMTNNEAMFQAGDEKSKAIETIAKDIQEKVQSLEKVVQSLKSLDQDISKVAAAAAAAAAGAATADWTSQMEAMKRKIERIEAEMVNRAPVDKPGNAGTNFRIKEAQNIKPNVFTASGKTHEKHSAFVEFSIEVHSWGRVLHDQFETTINKAEQDVDMAAEKCPHLMVGEYATMDRMLFGL